MALTTSFQTAIDTTHSQFNAPDDDNAQNMEDSGSTSGDAAALNSEVSSLEYAEKSAIDLNGIARESAVITADTQSDNLKSSSEINPTDSSTYQKDELQDRNGNGVFERSHRRPSILRRGDSNNARHSRVGMQVKKSVSFCSMPEDRRVSNACDCLTLMQEGTELTKLKANGRLYRRYYWLDNDLSEIRWMPTSKTYNKAKIQVSQIKEVQSGKNCEALKNKDIECFYQEEYMFTILYGSNYTSLDLVAKSPDEANIWIAGLTHLICKQDQNWTKDDNTGAGEGGMRTSIRDRWLAEMFSEKTGSTRDLLPEGEVVEMVLNLNPAVGTEYIKQKLKELYGCSKRVNSKGVLNRDEYISLYKDVASRQEIYFLMTKYGKSYDYMDAEDLMLFLETEQGMTDVSKKYCEELIAQYEPSREGRAKVLLGIDGLLAYLLSEECNIFNSRLAGVTQDMDQPLSHYFINSSHKTYLVEDQLKGPSSVTPYSRFLMQGCRYIEVDCWDGPIEPIVYHGRTLTSRILFSDVLKTVNEHAFLTSPYPVILSLENHCSLEQQQMMVDMLKATLGDKLYTSPINGNIFALPSPEKLKYKILVKCKKIDDTGEFISLDGEVSEEDETVDPDWKRLNRKEPAKRMPMLRELSDLVIWCQSCSHDKFLNHPHTQKPWHVTSVSDVYVHQLLEHSSSTVNVEDLISCNREYLSRVYPSCSKVDSSNFNPQPMWNCGFQLVALNQQSQGLETDLNIAKFKQNGNCGYVLKPALLRQPTVTFNPASTGVQNLLGIVPRVLQIKIISGHRFPKPIGSGTKSSVTDPYVLIEIFGIKADCANARTKTVTSNGQNPFFDESFTFYVNFPEMALVKLTILDDDFIGDEFIAQYTLPFSCINTGFRHVNLLSGSGEEIPGCTLFVHIATADAADKKPMKRGNSITNKLRVVKESIAIKPVGMKTIDDTAKCLLSNLSELAELRYNVENSLVKFKEACDVGSVANIKYCIRTIANRAFSTKGLTLKLIKSNDLPTFVISEGTPPDILKRALQAYLVWCKECKSLIDEGEPLRKTLLEIETLLLTFQTELNSYVEEASLSEKKSQKALDNFAWNMRVLKEQLHSLDRYTETCKNYFLKVVEAAQTTGVEIVTDTDR